jgi:hypothetical protein
MLTNSAWLIKQNIRLFNVATTSLQQKYETFNSPLPCQYNNARKQLDKLLTSAQILLIEKTGGGELDRHEFLQLLSGHSYNCE